MKRLPALPVRSEASSAMPSLALRSVLAELTSLSRENRSLWRQTLQAERERHLAQEERWQAQNVQLAKKLQQTEDDLLLAQRQEGRTHGWNLIWSAVAFVLTLALVGVTLWLFLKKKYETAVPIPRSEDPDKTPSGDSSVSDAS